MVTIHTDIRGKSGERGAVGIRYYEENKIECLAGYVRPKYVVFIQLDSISAVAFRFAPLCGAVG